MILIKQLFSVLLPASQVGEVIIKNFDFSEYFKNNCSLEIKSAKNLNDNDKIPCYINEFSLQCTSEMVNYQ